MIIEIPKGIPEKKIRALFKKAKGKPNSHVKTFLANCLRLEDVLKIQERLGRELK